MRGVVLFAYIRLIENHLKGSVQDYTKEAISL